MKSQAMPRVFSSWLFGAAAAALVLGVIYIIVQQNHRNGANHPQIEIAESTAAKLEASGAILDQIPSGRVDIASSPDVFVIIYDTEGGAIAGNGYLGGALLAPPEGIFDEAKTRGEYKVTLEPRPGLRLAAVIKPFVGREANGYVLAARMLK